MANASGAQTFVFEGFHLDVARRKLTGPDGPIEVPTRAFDVLLYMVTHPGELLDKARLMQAVWPGTVVEEGNLSQCIFALRRAFGDTASEPRFIATVSGRGYQFVARVRVVPQEGAAAEIATGRSRRWLYAVAGVAVAILIAFRFWPVSTTTRAAPSDPELAPASIAVLPFADLSSTRDLEYFAEGLAEELRNSLSKVRGLRIIGRHSSSAFLGQALDARSLGEKLHVAAILEGSVRKEGDRIDIKVHLIRTHDGVMLWSEMYDRQFDDVLDVEGSIAREVAATLAPAVRDSRKPGLPGSFYAMLTHDAEAYRAYLHGVYLFSRWIDADPQPARLEFQRAVERDPQFAMAYAMLARTYQWQSTMTNGDVAQNTTLGADAINKALKLDPTIGDLWWVRMFFLARDEGSYARTAAILEQAVAANPADIEPMIWLAHNYLVLARRDEALRMFERAYAADPLSPVANWNTAWYGYVFHGERQRLLELTDEMERLQPRDTKPSWTRSNLAFIEGRALDWDRFVARVIALKPDDHLSHAWLSMDYGSLGVLDAARYHARMCAKLDPQSGACTYSIARTEMLSGDIAAARKTVLEATARDPQNIQSQLALGELQYFTGDCAGALRSIAQARHDYATTGDALNLFHYNDDVPIFAWCLRQQGESARVAEMIRKFDLQNGPPTTGAIFVSLRARMAAATGNRDALVANLTALANSACADTPFVRHEPMIQAYLGDAEVVALLDKLEARHAEWRRTLPRASMRVPVPGVAAGS